MIDKNTEWVRVHVKATFKGDNQEAEKNMIFDVFLGEAETVEEKRILLYKKCQERVETSLKIQIDIIH